MREPLVAVDLRRGRILVGDGEELAKLLAPSPNEGTSGASSDQHAPGENSGASNSNGHRKSVRDFARSFAHRKLYERVALLFYYAHHIEGRSTLTTRDLSDWFGLCGYRVPTRMDKSLDNLMRLRHIVERTGPKQWSITASGESVALDLLEPATPNGVH